MGVCCSRINTGENESSSNSRKNHFSSGSNFIRNINKRNSNQSHKSYLKTAERKNSEKRTSDKLLHFPFNLRKTSKKSSQKVAENLKFYNNLSEYIKEHNTDSFCESNFTHLEKAKAFQSKHKRVSFKDELCEKKEYERVH